MEKKNIILICVSVLVIVGLFFASKCGSPSIGSAYATSENDTTIAKYYSFINFIF